MLRLLIRQLCLLIITQVVLQSMQCCRKSTLELKFKLRAHGALVRVFGYITTLKH